MLHVPARLDPQAAANAGSGSPTSWPWAAQIADAFATIMALPAPT